MSDNEYAVTQKEAADFLNVSTKSISRYRKKGLPYKLILNPVTGKQEVRFRYADLERWDEGRQLLATYARDGEDTSATGGRSVNESRPTDSAADNGFLSDLLAAYKEQIELLREQLEDMREQLARRDRQIDDLMRLMVGLQLEYKPMPSAPTSAGTPVFQETSVHNDLVDELPDVELFETVELPEMPLQKATAETIRREAPTTIHAQGKKVFSREQLSASTLQLRRKGKSYAEIATGLNRIGAATLSGQPEWTVLEVRTLLPALMETNTPHLAQEGGF
jgi:hypothetical protein